MAIKKSTLESKWYYRVIKIFFLFLPLFFLLYEYGMGYINFSWLLQENALNIISSNSVMIGYMVAIIIAYYLGLNLLWRAFLYMVFGGLEDDISPKKNLAIKKNESAVIHDQATPDNSKEVINYLEQKEKKRGEMIIWIILIICIIVIAMYGNINSNYVPGVPNPSPKCIPTGCGTSWYCSGSYYSDGVKKSIKGCYTSKTSATTLPSWSGTCRQCP